MRNTFVNIIYKILLFINFLTKKIFKNEIILKLKEFIENNLYKEIKIINNKNAKFFITNELVNWRFKTIFEK